MGNRATHTAPPADAVAPPADAVAPRGGAALAAYEFVYRVECEHGRWRSGRTVHDARGRWRAAEGRRWCRARGTTAIQMYSDVPRCGQYGARIRFALDARDTAVIGYRVRAAHDAAAARAAPATPCTLVGGAAQLRLAGALRIEGRMLLVRDRARLDEALRALADWGAGAPVVVPPDGFGVHAFDVALAAAPHAAA